MMDAEEACGIVDSYGDNRELSDPTVTWWNVARTLRQALAEAQQQAKDMERAAGGMSADLTALGQQHDRVEAERDALRRKLNMAIVTLEEIRNTAFYHMTRHADQRGDRKVLGVIKEAAIKALAVLESDPT